MEQIEIAFTIEEEHKGRIAIIFKENAYKNYFNIMNYNLRLLYMIKLTWHLYLFYASTIKQA
jgi:hypothetical protein